MSCPTNRYRFSIGRGRLEHHYRHFTMIQKGTVAAFGAIAWITLLAGSCGKECKDPIVLTFRAEMHDYLHPYKPGSWWVYLSNSGVQDSIYATDFREYSIETGRQDGPCYELSEVSYVIQSASMDQTGQLHARYSCGQEGNSTSFDLAPTSAAPESIGFGYHTAIGYGDTAAVIDTSINGITYVQALMVRVNPALVARDLRAFCLARDIGIVGYITTTDTFTLSTHFIP